MSTPSWCTAAVVQLTALKYAYDFADIKPGYVCIHIN